MLDAIKNLWTEAKKIKFIYTFLDLFLTVEYSLVALIVCGAIPYSPISSSSMKSSGFCTCLDAFSDLVLLNSLGVHPSKEPTVLKKPAEKPPVNAPWNLRRPWESVAICSSRETGFLFGKASANMSNF